MRCLRVTLASSLACLALGCRSPVFEVPSGAEPLLDAATMTEIFETHSGRRDRYVLWIDLINRISKDRKVTVAEIGVWRGDFAHRILANCPNVEKYYLVDPWRHLDDWKKPLNVSNEIFDRALAHTLTRLDFAKDRIEVLRGTTLEVIDRIGDGELDLVYIDGDHTAKGITIDLIKLYPKVRMGGVIGGDDFVDDIYHHGKDDYAPTMVKPVTRGFAAANGIEQIFHNESQFAFFR